jgi:hypothetical protein
MVSVEPCSNAGLFFEPVPNLTKLESAMNCPLRVRHKTLPKASSDFPMPWGALYRDNDVRSIEPSEKYTRPMVEFC